MILRVKSKVRSFLERQMNKQYARRLSCAKRRISYEDWLQQKNIIENAEEGLTAAKISAEEKASKKGNGSAEEEIRTGIDQLAKQGICLILQSRGRLDPNAPRLIADFFTAYPVTQVLYGDEDVLDETGEHRDSPYFKPDWSPDTWLSAFYLGSVIAVRRALVEQLPEGWWHEEQGGVMLFTETAPVRLLVHRLLELAGGFNRGSETIAHLPQMLFHMDHDAASGGMQLKYRQEDSFDCPKQELNEMTELLTVSVIIPSKDNPRVLGQCLDSLQKWQVANGHRESAEASLKLENRQSIRLEILVVDNGSSPENKAEIEKITTGMKYIYTPMPFNFSRMCNLGAESATGEVLLFLNDDITVCEDNWLTSMAERALLPYVGAVGLKLYYPGSQRIQHAGITNLPGGPVHKLQFTEDGQGEDYGYGSLDRNVIAVTGACLMVEKERFRQVGGFPEDLQVAYNDVDLCLSLREAGWHNVVLNHCHAYHHESLSRGSDLTREKLLRLHQERQTLYDRHPKYDGWDPYYPKPLCMELGDTHIYGNYIDNRVNPQRVSACRQLGEMPDQEPENLIFTVQAAECLQQSEESQKAGEGSRTESRQFCLQGYIVVRWENNACYNRYLLFQKQGEAVSHAIKLEPKYSGEAEFGWQEQPNVALCGFQVIPEKGILQDGSYRIGVQARSRLGRRRLTAWTELEIRSRDGLLETTKRCAI